nr:uncharacterized protein LOC115265589 [Aedes albopictus]
MLKKKDPKWRPQGKDKPRRRCINCDAEDVACEYWIWYLFRKKFNVSEIQHSETESRRSAVAKGNNVLHKHESPRHETLPQQCREDPQDRFSEPIKNYTNQELSEFKISTAPTRTVIGILN